MPLPAYWMGMELTGRGLREASLALTSMETHFPLALLHPYPASRRPPDVLRPTEAYRDCSRLRRHLVPWNSARRAHPVPVNTKIKVELCLGLQPEEAESLGRVTERPALGRTGLVSLSTTPHWEPCPGWLLGWMELGFQEREGQALFAGRSGAVEAGR